MRQITKDSISAFMSAKKFNRQNMQVEVLPNVTLLKLHNNIIAYRYNDPQRTLSITNCGWFSNTTKERLNQFLPSTENFHINVYQENFEWYWNITFRDQRKKRRIAEYNNDDVIKIWVDESGQYDFQLKDKKGRVKIG